MAQMTIAEFRQRYPSFTSALYPDSAVQIRLALADKFFSETLWNDPLIRNHAMGLYTAHYLEFQGSKASGGSGTNGAVMGVVSSKSVDGVSVSYDTGSSAWAGAGFWNATPYGRELWDLMGIYGAGARQL